MRFVLATAGSAPLNALWASLEWDGATRTTIVFLSAPRSRASQAKVPAFLAARLHLTPPTPVSEEGSRRRLITERSLCTGALWAQHRRPSRIRPVPHPYNFPFRRPSGRLPNSTMRPAPDRTQGCQSIHLTTRPTPVQALRPYWILGPHLTSTICLTAQGPSTFEVNHRHGDVPRPKAPELAFRKLFRRGSPPAPPRNTTPPERRCASIAYVLEH